MIMDKIEAVYNPIDHATTLGLIKNTTGKLNLLNNTISKLIPFSKKEPEPEPEPEYPPITRITNNNVDALPDIDFEILRPVEGTPDEVAEDITAAVLGRPE
jgi:hypothetical protein